MFKRGQVETHGLIPMFAVYLVVKFYPCLFQTHYHILPYQKTKEIKMKPWCSNFTVIHSSRTSNLLPNESSG